MRNDKHSVWVIFWALIYKATVYDVSLAIMSQGPFESVSANIRTHVTMESALLGDGLNVKLDRVLCVVDGLAAFVDANAPTLDALLRQAESSVDDEPVAPEPVAPVPAPVDNLAQILDEMRFQQREMRKYIALWALFVMFVVILFIAILDMVHAPVPAASPACCPECPVVNDWVVAKCFADEFVKNARDEWVRFTKK